MSVKGYICGTDTTEINLGATDVIIYPSVAALKKKRKCWKECGILEIEVEGRYVTPPTTIEQIIKIAKRIKNEKNNKE